MTIALHFAARTDVGLVRSNNQDSAYAGPHLLVVADGMGGHAGGDVASSVTVAQMAALDGESHGGDALALLEQAVRAADADLKRRVQAQPELAGMGTTVTAVLRTGDRLALAHIGDSRAYLLRDGQLSQLTRDHTFVQALVDDGRITAEEAESHPQRSVILRAIGDVGGDVEIDGSIREGRPGDRYLLCSDGLSGVVSDETLRASLAAAQEPGPTCDQLVQLALRGGGPDNITCVVADVVTTSGGALPATDPMVVGAAALNRPRGTSAATSPAARAAALTRPADTDDGDETPGPGRTRSRLGRRVLALLTLVLLLAGGAYAVFAWSQQQYFVGASGGLVAIYRGLSQDVGPVKLSRVHEVSDVAVDDLPAFNQRQIEGQISAGGLADARGIVERLQDRAAQCASQRTSDGAAAASASGDPDGDRSQGCGGLR